MEKKYKTVPEGDMLRIIALKDFIEVRKGDKGGLIEKESNLSQEGNCWIYEFAKVSGNARVSDNAIVAENAKVYEKAQISGFACVWGNAEIYGRAQIYGNSSVCGSSKISGDAEIYENAWVGEHADIRGNARIYGDTKIFEKAWVYENACVCGATAVFGSAGIKGNVKLWSTTSLYATAPIATSVIENHKDYLIIVIGREFRVISLKNKDINKYIGEDYINNIQTIRQLYGEKI